MQAMSRGRLEAAAGSPKVLLAAGFGFATAALALQYALALPLRHAFAPVEVGSALIATLGLAWALIQLKSWRGVPAARAVWSLGAGGMLLIAVEERIGELLGLENHGRPETALSIGLWALAAVLLLRAARLRATRRSVVGVTYAALAIQIAAQSAGWISSGMDFGSAGEAPFSHIAETGELAAVVAYLAALLLAEFAPRKDYGLGAHRIGAKGRMLFRDLALRRSTLYPTRSTLLQSAIARPLVLIAMIVWFGARVGPSVHRSGGPATLRQLRDLARLASSGVDAVSYYVLDLYRPDADFDAAMTRVETKNGLVKALQGLNADPAAPRDMNDKLSFYLTCRERGVPIAPLLAYVDRDGWSHLADPEAFDRDLYVKERAGCGGKFAMTFTRLAPWLYRDDDGAPVDLDTAMARIAETARRRRLVVQPKLANHPSIASLARDSLVVFRVVTCLDEAGEPQVTHGLLRILRKFEPSWPQFPEKEWGAPIDIRSGTLGLLAGDVAESCATRHHSHPVTGERVAGRRLRAWAAIAKTAVEAHRVYSGRTLVGWDIAWTPEGARVLEGNSNMDFAFIQRCYQTPLGRSPLGPLLDRQLDLLVERRARTEAYAGVARGSTQESRA